MAILDGFGEENRATGSAQENAQLEALVHRLTRYAQRFVRRGALSQEDSVDLVQEALLALTIRRLHVERPFPWLVTVLRRSALRLLRSQIPETIGLEDIGESKLTCLSTFEVNVLSDRLRIGGVLTKLRSAQQRILWLRFVAGMSWREIGGEFGCTPSAAKKALQRAVAAARQARQDQALAPTAAAESESAGPGRGARCRVV